jgi:hypothetical protein
MMKPITNDGIKAPCWYGALLGFLLFGSAGTIAVWAIISFISESNEGWWTP